MSRFSNCAETEQEKQEIKTFIGQEIQHGRFDTFSSESLRRLATWHSLEELEHKHVAFDMPNAQEKNVDWAKRLESARQYLEANAPAA